MPHKEERFLFVVYPHLCICAGVGASCLVHLLRGSGSSLRNGVARIVSIGMAILFIVLSLSRMIALVRNYNAPMMVWQKVHEIGIAALHDDGVGELPWPHPIPSTTNAPVTDEIGRNMSELLSQLSTPTADTISVCVGKEWYRFGTSFLLPTIQTPSSTRPIEFRLRFLESDFGGLLPKEFIEQRTHLMREAQRRYEELTKDEKQQLDTDSKLRRQFLQAITQPAGSPAPASSSPASLSSGVPPSWLPASLHSLFPHVSTRPGTFLLPTGMNRDNRKEDDGRFVKVEQCEYIVDLELEQQNEPKYSQYEVRLSGGDRIEHGRCIAGFRWTVVYSHPFLDAASSTSSIARAFYIPMYSEKKNVFRPYQLLKRIPIPCHEEEKRTQQP